MDREIASRSEKPVALITGASSGLGALFARELARRGYDLVLVARRKERLEALKAEIQSQHPVSVEVLPVDLSVEEEIARLEERVSQIENLEMLVNNAGFATVGRFARVEPYKHADMVSVHLMASVCLTRAALPGMLARRKGAIINVASVAAFAQLPGNAVYCATKAALVAFSRTLALELAGSGVRVQALCPGFIYTEFHDTQEYQQVRRTRVPGFMWGPAQPVVTASLRALEKDQVVCIPGGLYRFLSFFLQNQIFAPFVQIFIRWFFRRR